MVVVLIIGGIQSTLGVLGAYLWRTIDEARYAPAVRDPRRHREPGAAVVGPRHRTHGAVTGADGPAPPDWHHLPPNPYNPHAWILGHPEIGPGCWIGAFCVIDGSGGLAIGAG